MNDTLHTPTEGAQNSSAPHPAMNPDSSSAKSLIVYTVAALALAFFIRFFIAAPYVVSGASMIPTFYDYHYLIIDRVSYHFETPQRGDVIVLDLPQDTSRALIKRIIGLPGETVSLSGNTVTIINDTHPQGFVLTEKYLDPANLGGPSDIKVQLGMDEYYVLGDNRRVSADSRSWGKLPKQDIVGRAFLRLFPFNKIGILPGTARYDDTSIKSTNS
jgi:signal peptidase I